MLDRFVAALRGLLTRRRAERELGDELQFHIEMETEANIARGMSPLEARRAALLTLGGRDQTKEAVRDVRAMVIDSMQQDLRYAFRTLRRDPSFTCVAVVTLALAIGANTAIFGLTDAVLFRPLPYAEPGRLVWIMGFNGRTGTATATIPPTAYADVAASHKGLQAVSCSGWTGASFTVGDDSAVLTSAAVCTDLLDLLGVHPRLGRAFSPNDGAAGADVALLTYSAWQRYFRGDPAVVGRIVAFKERRSEIIGVLPPEFVLAPMLAFKQPEILTPSPRPSGRVVALARLKPGVTRERAQAELDGLAQGIEGGSRPKTILRLLPLQEGMFKSVRPLSFALVTAAGLVILLAIVNLGNLLMARGGHREHELAIRASLGAGRNRLVRQLLVEGVLLSLAGGLLGLLIASSTFSTIIARVPSRLFTAMPSGIDTRVLVFAFVLSVSAGLASAVLPAVRVTTGHLTWALQPGRRRGTRAGSRGGRGAIFVVMEMALVVVILTSAGLMLNSLVRAVVLDLGFDATNVIHVSSMPPRQVAPSAAETKRHYDQLVSTVRGLPGVTDVAAVCLLTAGGATAPFAAMTQEGPPEGRGARYYVTADYFKVLGIKVVTGRSFTASEAASAAPVAVVNEAAARRLWPGEQPVGRVFRTGSEPAREVIGVVSDTRDAYYQPVRPALYLPPDPTAALPMDVVAKVVGDPMVVARSIRARLKTSVPGAAVEELADVIADTTVGERFKASLLALFAALALLLAAVGVAGIVGYSVSRRTREIGTRLALGSTPLGVVLLVLRQSLTLVVLGSVLGVFGGLSVTRLLSGLLFQVKPNDSLTFGAAVGALLVVAALASLPPALRAARIDPTTALNSE